VVRLSPTLVTPLHQSLRNYLWNRVTVVYMSKNHDKKIRSRSSEKNFCGVKVGIVNNRTNLVVLNDDGNNIGASLGYSNGSFTQQIAILTSFSSSTNSIGNFNNNSRLICEYLFRYMPTIADFTVFFVLFWFSYEWVLINMKSSKNK
jgi:hypothetical protein